MRMNMSVRVLGVEEQRDALEEVRVHCPEHEQEERYLLLLLLVVCWVWSCSRTGERLSRKLRRRVNWRVGARFVALSACERECHRG